MTWTETQYHYLSPFYPFLAYLIAEIAEKYAGFSLDWLLNIPLMALVCASPLMLTKRDQRATTAKMRLSLLDKVGFIRLYFWIIVPLIVFISLYLGQMIWGGVFGMRLPINLLLLKNSELGIALNFSEYVYTYIAIISIIAIIAMVTVTLYYGVKVKKNRALTGLICFTVMMVLTPLFACIASIVICLLAYFKSHQANILESFQSYPLWVMYIVAGMYAVKGVIYFIKLYKSLGMRVFKPLKKDK